VLGDVLAARVAGSLSEAGIRDWSFGDWFGGWSVEACGNGTWEIIS